MAFSNRDLLLLANGSSRGRVKNQEPMMCRLPTSDSSFSAFECPGQDMDHAQRLEESMILIPADGSFQPFL